MSQMFYLAGCNLWTGAGAPKFNQGSIQGADLPPARLHDSIGLVHRVCVFGCCKLWLQGSFCKMQKFEMA